MASTTRLPRRRRRFHEAATAAPRQDGALGVDGEGGEGGERRGRRGGAHGAVERVAGALASGDDRRIDYFPAKRWLNRENTPSVQVSPSSASARVTWSAG